MKLSSINDWLTLAANIGVIAGIVFLGMEIRQNMLVTQAEMVSNFTDAWIDIDSSKQDGDFSTALAKSITNPQDLTLAEMIQLDGYYFSYLDQLSRAKELVRLGVQEETIEDLVRGSISDFFGNKYAQSWWAESSFKTSPEIAEIIDRELINLSPDHDMNYYESISSRTSR